MSIRRKPLIWTWAQPIVFQVRIEKSMAVLVPPQTIAKDAHSTRVPCEASRSPYNSPPGRSTTVYDDPPGSLLRHLERRHPHANSSSSGAQAITTKKRECVKRCSRRDTAHFWDAAHSSPRPPAIATTPGARIVDATTSTRLSKGSKSPPLTDISPPMPRTQPLSPLIRNRFLTRIDDVPECVVNAGAITQPSLETTRPDWLQMSFCFACRPTRRRRELYRDSTSIETRHVWPPDTSSVYPDHGHGSFMTQIRPPGVAGPHVDVGLA
ncbi:hypothetical protein HMN09_00129500 [Mycena chlorophos]|uniref:Uncharacterized protein n=1 Tax=Mycena chlorophos TaxID=658473 RepID=A0A8H6TT36_MYCCL|nr:hypothetical protein HMN09_00129500 [Mycena chlorophos]